MAKKLLERSANRMIKFKKKGEKGEYTVRGYRENIETKKGKANFIDLIDKNGEVVSIIATSCLKGYNWKGLIDSKVEIVYKGLVENEETGNSYKSYDVYEITD